MALRTFVDSERREWQVFDVVPRLEERRNYDRRSSVGGVPTFNDRRDADRRITVGRRSSLAGLDAGWLCFERTVGTERRRLSPIPADWRRCGEKTLESYWRAARPVRLDPLSLSELAERGR